jgi:hypothetical protein
MSTAAKRNPTDNSERMAYPFVLVLNGVSEIEEGLEDALFNAGCDDAILYSTNGQVCLEFDREAENLVSAVVSAIHAVESCGEHIKVREVLPPLAHEIGAVNAALQVRNEGSPLLRELAG